jgi:hypothetical protein
VAKTTVRFSNETLERIEECVGDGAFANQSEFQRFAAEYVLWRLIDGYDPQVTDFEELRRGLFSEDGPREWKNPYGEPDEFLTTASRVRQFASRGEVETARELIDSRYDPTSPQAMLLDDVVQGVCSRPRN